MEAVVSHGKAFLNCSYVVRCDVNLGTRALWQGVFGAKTMLPACMLPSRKLTTGRDEPNLFFDEYGDVRIDIPIAELIDELPAWGERRRIFARDPLASVDGWLRKAQDLEPIFCASRPTQVVCR